MPPTSNSKIETFKFSIFDGYPLTHAIFTRHGGVSTQPWSSLNVGGTVGDDPGSVQENRQRAFDHIERPLDSLHDVWQVHSADVVLAQKPRQGQPIEKADILITANRTVTLFMRFADCVPIYLYDPVSHAIGMVHAGWLGTVKRAGEVAVNAMVEQFGSTPSRLLAGIGPAIGPDHYEVRMDVVDQLSTSLGQQADEFISSKGGRIYLDLWSANRYLLECSGVSSIEQAGICTACTNKDWYSHRAEKGTTGRFAALFGLNE